MILNLLLITLSIFSNVQAGTIKRTGIAVNDKQEIVYTENQELTTNDKGESQFIKAQYYSPNKKLIAEITSDFKYDPYLPETVFHDYRFNEQQELHFDPLTQMITLKFIDSKNKEKQKIIKRENNMVAGQGFHNYIVNNFESKHLDIKFIVLPRLDYYSFQLDSSQGDNPNQKTFTLKISNWILRSIVQKITVDYRISDKTLLKFNGLTNIESDTSDSQILTITYPNEK